MIIFNELFPRGVDLDAPDSSFSYRRATVSTIQTICALADEVRALGVTLCSPESFAAQKLVMLQHDRTMQGLIGELAALNRRLKFDEEQQKNNREFEVRAVECTSRANSIERRNLTLIIQAWPDGKLTLKGSMYDELAP